MDECFARGRAFEVAQQIVQTIAQTASVSVSIIVPADGHTALEIEIETRDNSVSFSTALPCSPWRVQGTVESTRLEKGVP